jgi:predicted RNase H-like HicB family nuclease
MKAYAVVFEAALNNFPAYVPGIPGYVSTGRTREEIELHIREAIAFQIKGLRLIGEPVPEPSAWTGGVEQVA